MPLPSQIQRKLRDLAFGLFDYFQASENTIQIVLALIVGVLGGLGSVGFRLMIDSIQRLTLGRTGTDILERLNELPWYSLLALPALGGVVVGPLVYFLAREAKGHGVPEVMEAVALHGGRIRPRLVLVKSLASAITIATGGSVGREGPIVQVGSAIGSSIGLLLRLPQERLRVLVGCGAAAGIAATFNAPVAAVIFSVELILGNYAITTLTPLIISSVAATVVCYAFPAITGGNVRAFDIPFHWELTSAWEIPLFALLGVVAGLVALLFIVSIYKAEDLFDALPIPPWIKPVAGGLLLGGLFLLVQRTVGHVHIFGIGYQTIETLLLPVSSPDPLRAHMVWYVILALLAFKLIATPLTIGCGLSGGVFAPSLFVGALTGALFGVAMNALFPEVTGPVGAYALVGMAAVVAGATHAPIMAILMLFELSGDYQIILPLMLSCVIASLLASRLKKDSIYTLKLSRRGINLSKGLETTIMETTVVGDVMRTEAPTVREDETFGEVLRQLLDGQHLQLYVVDEAERLKGVITLHNAKAVIAEQDLAEVLVAADLMDTTFPRMTPASSLADCAVKFGTSSLEELPLLDEETREHLVGVVSRRDVFQLYNHEVLRRGTLGLKFVRGEPEHRRADYVEMPPDHIIEVVPVTAKMAGKSLRDLDLRNRFHVNVVAVRSHRYAEGQGPDSDVPDPTLVLRRTHTLIVTGTREDIEEMRAAFAQREI